MNPEETEQDRDPGDAPGASASREAIRRLFVEHNGQLVRFVRMRGSSEQEARDVAQEAYARLLALEDRQTINFLRAYLYRIAGNIVTDRFRRRSFRDGVLADPVFRDEVDGCTPERIAAGREQISIIEDSLRELPEKVRMSFVLHRIDGIRVDEVADRLGISERSARNYILAAMVHCKKRLSGQGLKGKVR